MADLRGDAMPVALWYVPWARKHRNPRFDIDYKKQDIGEFLETLQAVIEDVAGDRVSHFDALNTSRASGKNVSYRSGFCVETLDERRLLVQQVPAGTRDYYAVEQDKERELYAVSVCWTDGECSENPSCNP